MTESQKMILEAVADLKSIHQAIGNLGIALRRTIPGTKKHRKYYDAMTSLERQSCEASEKITNFVLLGDQP